MPCLAPRAMPLVWNLLPLLLLLAWSGLNGSPLPTILPCASAFVTPCVSANVLTTASTTCTTALAARIGNTPAQDGGATPTAAEQQEINDCKAAVYVPSNFLGDGTRQLYLRFLYSNRKSDGVLFRVLKLIRDGTPVSYIDVDPDIYWSDEVKKIMWYAAKPYGPDLAGKAGGLSIPLLYRVLKYAPDLHPASDELTEDDYVDMYGKCIQPGDDRQMMVDSAEACFLWNAPAFCQPMDGTNGKTVIDLDYLQKYQVKKGTPARYGGKVVVQGGRIVEINGISPGDDGFEQAKHVFLSAFAVHLVVVRHAMMAHLAIYQKKMMDLTTERSDEFKASWEANPGADLFLRTITSHRANQVNTNIQLLIGPGNSLVGRATSLTNDSLTLLGIDMWKKYTTMNNEELIQDIGTSGSKVWEAACNQSWKAAKTAVQEICSALSKEVSEEDKENLAMLVWVSTFYHGFIGDFQLNNVNKGYLPFTLTGKPHVQDKAYGTLSTTIGVSTMTRTQNMDTLGSFLPEDYQRQAWGTYQRKLAACAKTCGVKEYSLEGPVYNAINF